MYDSRLALAPECSLPHCSEECWSLNEVLCALSTICTVKKQTWALVLFPWLHLACFKTLMSWENKFSKKYLVLINFIMDRTWNLLWECPTDCAAPSSKSQGRKPVIGAFVCLVGRLWSLDSYRRPASHSGLPYTSVSLSAPCKDL